MSQNITISDFREQLAVVQQALSKRWPWMEITVSDTRIKISVQCSLSQAGVELRIVDGGLVPSARMPPSVGMGDNLADSARSLYEAGEVLAALNTAISMIGDVIVFLDDHLPCRSCNGQGRVRLEPSGGKRASKDAGFTLVPCERCNGSKIEPSTGGTNG